jgi:hypothetical protein
MEDSDPRRGRTQIWMVKLRLAIDAEGEPEARAIAGEVIQAMHVAVAGELQVTPSASRRPFWISSPTLTYRQQETSRPTMPSLVSGT